MSTATLPPSTHDTADAALDWEALSATATGLCLEDVDPRELRDNPRNLRTEIGDLSDLTASMAEVGIKCPLIVLQIDDNVFQILIGHRRKYAAIELGFPLVPCVVTADEGEAAQIVAQLAENGHRVGLSPTEEAEGFYQLTLLDWTPEQIAKVRAVPTADIRNSLHLRALPETARTAVDAGMLTLEDAAAMTEFADQPAALDRIMKSAGNAWALQHAISNERAKRDFATAKERLKAELVLAGVKVTSKPKNFGHGSTEVAANQLADPDGQRVDDTTAMALPGFAVFIEKVGGTARPYVYCTDPDKHGYTRRAVANRYVGMSEAQSAEREQAARRRAEFIEAFTVATGVRRDFYRKTYASARAAKRLFPESLRGIVSGDGPRRDGDVDGLYPALGGADDDVIAAAGEDRLRRCLVAQWVCAHENNLRHATSDHTWGLHEEAAAFWLDYLVTDGYVLSEAEAEFRQKLADEEEADENAHLDEPALDADEPEAATERQDNDEDDEDVEGEAADEPSPDGADVTDPHAGVTDPDDITDWEVDAVLSGV